MALLFLFYLGSDDSGTAGDIPKAWAAQKPEMQAKNSMAPVCSLGPCRAAMHRMAGVCRWVRIPTQQLLMPAGITAFQGVLRLRALGLRRPGSVKFPICLKRGESGGKYRAGKGPAEAIAPFASDKIPPFGRTAYFQGPAPFHLRRGTP